MGSAEPPKYVRACADKRWHLKLEPYDARTGELGAPLRVPFNCHSWRHAGACRRWIAAQNFARISEALATVQKRHVMLAVFTLRPSDWRDRWQAFAELSARWRSLLKAITRTYGESRGSRLDSKGKARKLPNVTPHWVGTVEIHKSGWPHLNVILCCRELAEVPQKQALAWLKRHAVMCGFGPMASLERAKSKRAVAGYAVKVAGETDAPRAALGEVVKLTQLPLNAPPHFRRLRSSKGFLPPTKKGNGLMIGALERFPLPPKGWSPGPLPPAPHLRKPAPFRQEDLLDVGGDAAAEIEEFIRRSTKSPSDTS